jgi:hypothetical protein
MRSLNKVSCWGLKKCRMWYLSDLHGNSFRFVSIRFDMERFLNTFEMVKDG